MFDAKSQNSKETTQDAIYRRIRQSLLTGQASPGEALSIRRLVEKFEVSATPVRDALSRLEAEFVLVRGPNRVLMIPNLSVGELKDIHRLRAAIEGLSAELAADRATSDEIKEVSDLCDTMDAALAKGDADTYLTLNWAFHRSIYKAAHSDVALHIIENLWLRSGPYLRLPVLIDAAEQPSQSRQRSMQFHRACLAALQAGDADAARDAIQSDIAAASDELFQYMKAAHAAEVDNWVPDLRVPSK
ncbi:GntR family transcriptional regulator [Shimia aestuarii]|uniref:DNA-binding transcriptional regulator, GntR family n=1 Tax=Shimia aestuarii TaxID=254406 RepID=A0A1I4T8B5_9RHOB|nr:GntR family transcriptional regulator [Shimia aestuarii]SFM72833.1 DNA-binding transcriptional regulator, GntR family [Shimia aestuarii]